MIDHGVYIFLRTLMLYYLVCSHISNRLLDLLDNKFRSRHTLQHSEVVFFPLIEKIQIINFLIFILMTYNTFILIEISIDSIGLIKKMY